MTENVEDQEYVGKFIPGSCIEGYDEYCLVAHVYGYEKENGEFLADWNEADGSVSQKILSQHDLIERPGFLVLNIGSAEGQNEIGYELTVDSACKAIHSSLISLFASCDIDVDFERMRTAIELEKFMGVYLSKYTHVILIGHGSQEGIKFLDRESQINGLELANLIDPEDNLKSFEVISFCCHSGCDQVAADLSQSKNIEVVIAPEHTFDMRWVVHFLNGYLLHRFMNQASLEDAVSRASSGTDGTPMCVWENGNKTKSAT